MIELTNVLVITFRYPPNGETAANRPLGWTEYMHKYGYKPIIVTRNWDIPISENNIYQNTPSGTEVIHQVYDTHEVYYLPYKGNFRTSFFLRHRNKRYRFVYKAMSFFEQLTASIGFRSLSDLSIFFSYIDTILLENKAIELAIVTAQPWKLLHLGKILNQKYRIKWIADYRDPWTTEELPYNPNPSILHKILSFFEQRAELNWCTTASHITSVSDYITSKLTKFLGVPASTIYNGYLNNEKDYSFDSNSDAGKFVIVYNGTLLPFHKIEIFLDGLKQCIEKFQAEVSIKLVCVGTAFMPESALRVKNYMLGFENNIEITTRIPKPDYLIIQRNAQLLLMAGAGPALKGITSSKVFDYITSRKPVMLVPNDKDVVEKILTETGQGIFADSAKEVFEKLSTLIEEYKHTGTNKITYNQEYVQCYSRENQTQKLAQILDSIHK